MEATPSIDLKIQDDIQNAILDFAHGKIERQQVSIWNEKMISCSQYFSHQSNHSHRH